MIDNATFLSDKEAAIPDHDLEAAADMDEDLDCISNSLRYIHGYCTQNGGGSEFRCLRILLVVDIENEIILLFVTSPNRLCKHACL